MPAGQTITSQVKTVYLDEKKVESGGIEKVCEGSGNVPLAENGFLCVYQSAIAEKGSQATEWKEAGFFAIEDAQGNLSCEVANTVCAPTGKDRAGALVVFRTTTFEGGVGAPKTLPAAASLTAAGAWAVRAK